MKAYNICLRLKTPSIEGKQLDFIEKASDISESVEIFNDKFSGWSKTIIIKEIQKDRINLLLILEKEKHNISTREIRSFTAYLYHEKMWNIYSRETAKLFEGIIFKEVDIKDLVSTLYELKNSKLAILNHETLDKLIRTINSINNVTIIKTEIDLQKATTEFIGEKHEELSDEQCLSILNYLISTKSIGANHQKKKDTISKIKAQLLQWV